MDVAPKTLNVEDYSMPLIRHVSNLSIYKNADKKKNLKNINIISKEPLDVKFDYFTK